MLLGYSVTDTLYLCETPVFGEGISIEMHPCSFQKLLSLFLKPVYQAKQDHVKEVASIVHMRDHLRY